MSELAPEEVHANKLWARFLEELRDQGLEDWHAALVRGGFVVSDRLEDFMLLLLDVCACAGMAIAFPDGDPVVQGTACDWCDEVLQTRGYGRHLPPANDDS